MKKILLYIFLMSISSILYCEKINSSQENSSESKNNYILKIIPIDKYQVVQIGKTYYTVYRDYETKFNQEVTNYTVPKDFRDFVSFKLILKKNPMIQYNYKYNFNGINIDYKFLKLDKAFQFLSYLIY